jgi:hypothetical protein
MTKWLITSDADASKVLAMHGWTQDRRQGLVFNSEFEAQAWIEARRAPGHTTQASAADLGGYPGTATAAASEYDPYGLAATGRNMMS